MAKKYKVSDGRMVLELHPLRGGGYGVTSPDDPALITEATTVEDAFVMARDAAKSLARSRAKEKLEFTNRRKAKTA